MLQWPEVARIFLLLLLTAAALPAAAIIDDTFADGNSRNQDLAAQSLRIFQARAGTVRTDTPGQAHFDITNAGGSEAFWAFFTESGAPVDLQVGDRLRVSVTFSLSGFPANGQDIRFGVFNSQGTRTTVDLTGGMNHVSFTGDTGYGLQFYPSGTGQAFNLGRRANLETGNIFNTFADFTTLTARATPNPNRATLAENTPYTLHVLLERLSETETRMTAHVEGGTLDGLQQSAVDTGAALPSAFDSFAFRVTGPAFAQRIAFTRITVDYLPAPPVITLQPQPARLTLQAGANVTWTVGARGAALRYQWNQDGAPVNDPTATSATLRLNNVPLTAAGVYTATVSNEGGTVTTDPVTLRVSRDPVAPPPAITTQPAPVTVVAGEAATLSVSATGAGLSYQWFFQGAAIPGATASTLRIAAAQLANAGEYYVLIANETGVVQSAAARVTVVSALTAVSTYPASGATGLCVDPPLAITFNGPPRVGRTGQIRLMRSDGTVADTIDLRGGTGILQRTVGGVPYNYYPVIVEDNTARLFFPRPRLTPGEQYTIEADAGVLTDTAGVPWRGSAGRAWSFSVRTAGPDTTATALTVDAAGTGDYCTVQSAIDHVPANAPQRTVISVKPGHYVEQVYVASTKRLITVRGEDRATVIRYPNNASLNSAQRQVFGVDAPDFTLEHITVHNTTPRGGSQAEAFRGNAQRIALNYVNLISFQDTLWLQGLAFVNASYIEGDVDFLWGNGSVFIQDSELRMVSSGGYYTQIRNPQDRVGMVFVNCRLTAAPGVTGGYLSRIDPGVYPFSQVVFINSAMGAHIRPEGWLLNNATAAPTVQFFEYNSRDEQGAPLDVRGRAPFSRQLTAAEAERWRYASVVLGGGWDPTTRLSAGVELSELDRNFTGSPVAVTVRTTPPGLAVRVTYAGSENPPNAVGAYPVRAEISDDRYQGVATGTLTIRPTPVSITLSNLTQTFDGQPKPVRVTANPATAEIRVNYNGSEAVPVQPGRYSVVAAVANENLRGRTSATLTIRAADDASLLAFPGAEGEGAYTVGGRGGDVYRVTNLNDAGPGSLRFGIQSATGPRTIVFAVGGLIRLQSRLSINRSFLTIAGQTAPGGGITIAGWPTVISGARHVVLRYLRFRMGDVNCPAVQDDALWVDRSSDVIIDHVSASWSVDETLSVTDATRVSVQWSFITESLRNSCHEKGAHGYGSLIRFGDGLVSFHHNLFAHHDSRNPRVGDNIGLDFVNNVIYNWGGTSGYSGAEEEGRTRVNLTANAYLAGPSTAARPRIFNGGSVNTAIYQESNRLNGVDPEWAGVSGAYTRREDARFDLAQVETAETGAALEQVLTRGGASLVRDAVDERIVREVRTRAGKLIDSQREVGGWPDVASGAAAPADSDGDGMPDAWESARGLNPQDARDGARPAAAGGYTNLELYLNSLLP